MSIRTDRIHSRLTPVEPAAERLPFWSRSTNPIVRRHLGLYWRTLPPELQPVLRIALVWIALLIGGVLFLDVLQFALVFLIVSFVVLPVLTLWYAHLLIEIAVRSAAMMQQERRDNTLTLLMTTPMSLEQILLGKVAAAFWRRMDDWVLIVYGVALAAPPAIYSAMSPVWQGTGVTAVGVGGGGGRAGRGAAAHYARADHDRHDRGVRGRGRAVSQHGHQLVRGVGGGLCRPDQPAGAPAELATAADRTGDSRAGLWAGRADRFRAANRAARAYHVGAAARDGALAAA